MNTGRLAKLTRPVFVYVVCCSCNSPWRDSLICQLLRYKRMSHATYGWITSCMSKSRHMSSCDMTYSRVTWLIHIWCKSFMYDMTHSHVTRLIHVWHDACRFNFVVDCNTCMPWLIHMWCDLFMRDMIYSWPDSCMSDMTHSYAAWLMQIFCVVPL